jgi:hypothetical protein
MNTRSFVTLRVIVAAVWLVAGTLTAGAISVEQPVLFSARGGTVTLEGMVQASATGAPRAAAVICHPNPLAGGSMDNGFIRELQQALAHAGLVTLRFNFRGVGRSTGAFAGGSGEVDDCLGALDLVRQRSDVVAAQVVVVGYSFGAVVGLHACVREGGVPACVCIGFPARSRADLPTLAIFSQVTFPTLFVAGTEDNVSRLVVLEEAVRTARVENLCRLEPIVGGDHLFSALAPRALAIKRVVKFVTNTPSLRGPLPDHAR